jgi:WD40 repeat protein
MRRGSRPLSYPPQRKERRNERHCEIALWSLFFCLAGVSSDGFVAGHATSPQAAATPVVLQGHSAGVTAVQFSPDGAWLASSSLDGTVRIWSARTWDVTRVLKHGAEVYAITFSPDGRTLVSGGYDRRLIIWETGSGRLRRAINLPDWPNAITFTTTGQLVVGCADGQVRLMNPGTGAIERTINTENSLTSLAVSADGRYLATGIPIKLWDLATGKPLAAAFGGMGHYGLAFTPSGEYLASAEGTAGGRILSVPTGEIRQRLLINVEKRRLGPNGFAPITVNMPATAVAVSRDGTWLATRGSDSAVQLWRVPGEGVVQTEQTPARVFTGHKMTVTGVSFSPDGRHLASASLDRTLQVWELQ